MGDLTRQQADELCEAIESNRSDFGVRQARVVESERTPGDFGIEITYTVPIAIAGANGASRDLPKIETVWTAFEAGLVLEALYKRAAGAR